MERPGQRHQSWRGRGVSVSAVLAVSSILGITGCSTSPEQLSKADTITTISNPESGPVGEFRSALEDPAKDFSTEVVGRLMGAGSVTERIVSRDSTQVVTTNKMSTAGADRNFRTEDDPLWLPEARAYIATRGDGSTDIFVGAYQCNGPLGAEDTKCAHFEASFHTDAAVDPTVTELGDIQDLLSEEGTALTKLDARGFNSELGSLEDCYSGLEVFDNTSDTDTSTLGCVSTVSYGGPLEKPSAEIGYLAGELEAARRDVLDTWAQPS